MTNSFAKNDSKKATRERFQGTIWRKSSMSSYRGHFLSRWCTCPIVDWRIYTSCEEACMGTFETAPALGFIRAPEYWFYITNKEMS